VRTAKLRGTKSLIASLAIVGLLLAGIAAPAGAVSGHGRINGSLRLSPGTAVTAAVAKAGLPMSGRVVFKPEHGREIVVGVSKSGTFTLNLRAGTYTAFGGGRGWFPQCQGNGGKPFTVVAGHTYKVAVWCVAM
jgi:hypothetical protein